MNAPTSTITEISDSSDLFSPEPPEYAMQSAWLELRKCRVALAKGLGLTYAAAAALGWDNVLSVVCDRAKNHNC